MFTANEKLHQTLKPFEGTNYGKLKLVFVGEDYIMVLNDSGSHMLIPYSAIRCVTVSRDESEVAWINGHYGKRIP